jgi:hypothetical protein
LLQSFHVYRLPDGAEMYAVPVGGMFLLYAERGARIDPPSYVVTPGGEVRRWPAGACRWRIEELTDTGRLYPELGGRRS